MTPEEDVLIRLALRWHRGWITDQYLHLAVQELKISRQPMQGPEPIPCMARARYSDALFCVLPKGHVGLPGRSDRWNDYHQGRAAGTPPRGGGIRAFQARVPLDSAL